MTEVVLDASVLVKWFHHEGEHHVEQARLLRQGFEAGDLGVLVPPLIEVELLNVAGRRWQWPADKLAELATSLSALGFERVGPELTTVATWCSQGLTAYDATYVAVAESTGSSLVTADEEILAIAPTHTVSLAEWA